MQQPDGFEDVVGGAGGVGAGVAFAAVVESRSADLDPHRVVGARAAKQVVGLVQHRAFGC